MQIIGAGVGRTGTFSLKTALNQLGLGPCHHMEMVLQDLPAQVPLWMNAINGNPDWRAAYNGCQSAVDWPTALFFRELNDAFPSAKFILTHRSPESWAESFSETIQKLVAGKDQAPPEMQDFLAMAESLITKSGFSASMNIDALTKAFVAHNEAVKEAIPATRLLVYEVKHGWEPLCSFLQVPVPDSPFPRTNGREEFWELARGKQQ